MKPVLSETVGAQRAICFKGRTEEEIACRLPQKMCVPWTLDLFVFVYDIYLE